MINTPVSIREINRKKLLNTIRRHPGISRARLVELIGLSKATVTKLIYELIEEEFLLEDGVVNLLDNQAGRRPIRLKLNGNYRYAIGIELTGDECIVVLTDLNCNIVEFLRFPIDLGDVNLVVDRISQGVNEIMVNYPWDRLLGVQIGAPASVDIEGQIIIQAENFAWYSVPLAKLIQEKLNKPVALINRQMAGAVGEYWYGHGRGHNNLIYITHNIGIGSGIIINNQLYTGNDNSAGEFGHISVVPDGDLCACGNIGCLETVASGPAIIRRTLKLIPDYPESSLSFYRDCPSELNVGTVLAAAVAKDQLALDVILKVVNYLSMGIVTLINLFNPSVIILSGLLAHDSDFFLDRIIGQVRAHGFSVNTKCLQIVNSILEDKAVPIGAASLMIDRLFT